MSATNGDILKTSVSCSNNSMRVSPEQERKERRKPNNIGSSVLLVVVVVEPPTFASIHRIEASSVLPLLLLLLATLEDCLEFGQEERSGILSGCCSSLCRAHFPLSSARFQLGNEQVILIISAISNFQTNN